MGSYSRKNVVNVTRTNNILTLHECNHAKCASDFLIALKEAIERGSMSDALVTGCELILESGSSSLKANSKDCRNYERRITKDGVYAEGLYYLKDDIDILVVWSANHFYFIKVFFSLSTLLLAVSYFFTPGLAGGCL